MQNEHRRTMVYEDDADGRTGRRPKVFLYYIFTGTVDCIVWWRNIVLASVTLLQQQYWFTLFLHDHKNESSLTVEKCHAKAAYSRKALTLFESVCCLWQRETHFVDAQDHRASRNIGIWTAARFRKVTLTSGFCRCPMWFSTVAMIWRTFIFIFSNEDISFWLQKERNYRFYLQAYLLSIIIIIYGNFTSVKI